MLRTWLLCFVLTSPLVCYADIYGYIDGDGIVHISNAKEDDRYFLFRKQVEVALAAPVENPHSENSAAGFAALGDVRSGKQYSTLIMQVAREHDIDAALVHAVVAAESGFDARALSPKGAGGLMQLMPDTAQRYGVSDVWNPLQNLRGGVHYLKDLLALFKDNVKLALAAYNAGEGAVISAGNNIPPYAETRSYVPRVLQLWEKAREHASSPRP